jgi:hypothetical protein
VLDAKRDLRSVGDEMIIDLLRVVACPRHMATGGEPRPIAQRGTGIVRWTRNLNLGVTHHSSCRVPIAPANRPEGGQSAEDEPQQAAYPSVAAGCDNVRRFKGVRGSAA